MPVKLQLSFFKPLWFFLSIFISTYQLFNQNKGWFWVSHFSPYNEENEALWFFAENSLHFWGGNSSYLKTGCDYNSMERLKIVPVLVSNANSFQDMFILVYSSSSFLKSLNVSFYPELRL